MKFLKSLLLSLSVVFFLAACGGSDTQSEESATDAETETPAEEPAADEPAADEPAADEDTAEADSTATDATEE